MSGAGSERRLTARLARFFAAPVGEPSGPSPLVDLGDDAAVVPRPPGAVVLCCDPVVAGVHFTAADAPALVGRKVVNRNLSDLAAMGALPDWLLLSLVLPRGTAAGWRDALLGGVRRAAR
ncbi:MAG: hypothetical protein KDE27_02485, partial [Planctomycetes bacterium]|nr:hypothetical protein [Planctomycetota bacterium]